MSDEQLLKDAQFRKSLSISFFNSTNSAIELYKVLFQNTKTLDKDKFIEIRDWMIDEHKKYYSTVIANIGQNYNAKETIEKLKTAKTIEELKEKWIALSEDERRDEEIIKEVNLLKQSYAKI